MNDTDRLRQFWQRVILASGIFLGTPLLVVAPFTFRGEHDSTLDFLAVIINALSLLPSCVLAFWHRRIACIWLTGNAVVLASAVASMLSRKHMIVLGSWFEIALSIVIAAMLDYAEIGGWPSPGSRSYAR